MSHHYLYPGKQVERLRWSYPSLQFVACHCLCGRLHPGGCAPRKWIPWLCFANNDILLGAVMELRPRQICASRRFQ